MNWRKQLKRRAQTVPVRCVEPPRTKARGSAPIDQVSGVVGAALGASRCLSQPLDGEGEGDEEYAEDQGVGADDPDDGHPRTIANTWQQSLNAAANALILNTV